MNLFESGEMYLEAILVLSQKNPFVRAIDIGEYRGYSKPSVSRAMNLLRDGGYIAVDAHGCITLTDAGREVAETIYERHTVLTDILTGLGVDADTAAVDACRMEHYISNDSFQALKRHFNREAPG